MRNKNNKKPTPLNVKAFNFSTQPTQLPIETPKGGRKSADVMMYWGNSNLYPNYLLGLYKDSPSHKGILNSKYTFIHGNGLIYENTDEYADFMVNDDDSIVDLFEKVTKDFLIFNSYAIEVIYDRNGQQVKYNHIPVDRLRLSKNKKHFWYCEDWYLRSTESIHFDSWSAKVKDDLTSKIFYYQGYTPSPSFCYPTPDYSGCLISIENDIAIRDFHRNNLKNNFSVSSIITFFGGEPEDEVADKLLKDLENSYQGVNGKRMLINFSDESGKGAEVTNISSSSFNDAFLTLKENTDADIVIGHSLPSPALAGIALAGQLGANQTLTDAYSIFRANFVLNKRVEILKGLNKLFKGYFNPLDIKDDADRFGDEELDPMLEKIMLIDEIRELKGLPKLPNNEGQKMIGAQPIQPAVNPIPTATESKFSKEDNHDEEIEDETFSKIAHFGLDKDDFVIFRTYKFSENLKFESDKRLTDYLIANTPFAGNSLRGIQTALDNQFTIQEIREELAKLVSTKVIPMTSLIEKQDIQDQARKLNVNPSSNNTSKIKSISVMYSYEGIADDKNRPTCHKLVRSNKLYSREEIESMSAVLGWDVFQFAMGKNCRHSWVKHSVVRR